MVTAARAAFHHGSVAYFLARLAATLGDHQAADELYTDAQCAAHESLNCRLVDRLCCCHQKCLLSSRVNPTGSFTAER